MKKLGVLLAGVLLFLGVFIFPSCAAADKDTKYAMSLEYFPETQTLAGEMAVSVYNDSGDAYSTLDFFLAPNAYREGAKYPAVSALYEPAAYYAGESYGNITFTGGEGTSLAVCGEDENILRATLKQPLYPDERAEVSFSFQTKLASVNHRLGVGQTAINLHGFYPLLCLREEGGWQEVVYSCLGDPFLSEIADYALTLTLPEGYSCAYAGEGEQVAKNGKTEYDIRIEDARDCALVLGKDMRLLSEKVNGVCVEYFAFGEQPSDLGFQVAKESLSYFSQTFSAYPYSRYAVVQTSLCHGGMESSGLSLVSNALQEKEIPAVVAHETAHQWWYSLVGSDQVGEAWQDEGLAEYSTLLFFEAHPDYGVTREGLVDSAKKAFRAYFSLTSQLQGKADTGMSRPLSSFSGEYEYVNIAYHKGMLLFESLRDYLGDGVFFAGLKGYAKGYAGKIASVEALSSRMGGGKRGGELIASFTEGRCVI